MSQSELESLLIWWQQALKVQDWTVKLVFKRSWDIEDNSLGNCRYAINRKTATITLLDTADAIAQEEDNEETLVHELLHLHTAPLDNTETGRLNSARRVALEQMVDLVAVCLVSLRRSVERERLQGRYEGLGRSEEIIKDVLSKIEGGL